MRKKLLRACMRRIFACLLCLCFSVQLLASEAPSETALLGNYSNTLILTQAQYASFDDAAWAAINRLNFSSIVFLPDGSIRQWNDPAPQAEAIGKLIDANTSARSHIWIGLPALDFDPDDSQSVYETAQQNAAEYMHSLAIQLKSLCEQKGVFRYSKRFRGLCLQSDALVGTVSPEEPTANPMVHLMSSVKSTMEDDAVFDISAKELLWISDYPTSSEPMSLQALAIVTDTEAGLNQLGERTSIFDYVFLKPQFVSEECLASADLALGNLTAVYNSVAQNLVCDRAGAPLFSEKASYTDIGFVVELNQETDPPHFPKPRRLSLLQQQFKDHFVENKSAFYWKDGRPILSNPAESSELQEFYIPWTASCFLEI